MVNQRSSSGNKPTRSPQSTSLKNTSSFFQRKWPCGRTLRTSMVSGYCGSGTRSGNARADGSIDGRGRLHLQRLVGTHVIVFLAKAVQRALLLAPVGGGRLSGLLLQ